MSGGRRPHARGRLESFFREDGLLVFGALAFALGAVAMFGIVVAFGIR